MEENHPEHIFTANSQNRHKWDSGGEIFDTGKKLLRGNYAKMYVEWYDGNADLGKVN